MDDAHPVGFVQGAPDAANDVIGSLWRQWPFGDLFLE